MNLIDESKEVNKGNKKIFLMCGIGIAVLLCIIIALVIITTVMNSKKKSLIIDGSTVTYESYIIQKDNILYIGVEDLAKKMKNGYSYKSGSTDVEDENKCYITNTYESTFFEVGSNKIYKILEDTNETEYYNLENAIIKENNKIYVPINSVKTAFNARCKIEENKITISSIAHIESVYNKQASTSFTPNSSIVWETTYSNKKLLKNDLSIVQDEVGNLGVAEVKLTSSNDKKTVTTNQIITPKYIDIKYIESFNQLIVETESGKGIIQLKEANGAYTVETAIVPQYEDIQQINENLFLVSETVEKTNGSNTNTNANSTTTEQNSTVPKKYGIVNKQGDTVVPMEYDQIGIDISNFTNNDLDSKYIIYNNYIPVKKNKLWGFINLEGKVTINLQYDDLGCIGNNPSSNVLIIPEIEAIVVKKGEKYGIIRKTGKILMQNTLTKVYKETSQGKEVYNMVYVGNKLNVVEYINKLYGDDYKKETEESKNSENTVVIKKDA